MTKTVRDLGLAIAAFVAIALVMTATPLRKHFNSPADDCLDYYRPAFVNADDIELVSTRTTDGLTQIEIRGDHRLDGLATYKAACGFASGKIDEQHTNVGYYRISMELQLACLDRNKQLWDAAKGRFSAPTENCENVGRLMRQERWIGG